MTLLVELLALHLLLLAGASLGCALMLGSLLPLMILIHAMNGLKS